MSLERHLRECLEESGIDPDEATAVSCERKEGIVESWYQEAAIWKPWKAFAPGFGTASGFSREEAIAELQSRMEKGPR